MKTTIQINTELDGVPDVVEQWSVNVGGRIQHSRPAIGDELLFVDSLDPRFFALSRETGTVEWSKPRDGSLSDSAPTYHDGTVFVGSGGGTVHAFDAVTGDERWRFSGDSAITASPVVLNETVFVGRNDGDVLALDASDGSLVWRASLEGSIYANPAASAREGTIFVNTNSGSVAALDAIDGQERWSRNLGADVGSSAPAVDESRGLVYLATNEVMALAADTGEPAWVTDFYGASAGASPVFDDDAVYVGGGDGNVYAVLDDGHMLQTAPKWTYEQLTTVVADPALLAGRLIVGGLNGSVKILDTETGEWQTELGFESEIRGIAAVSDDEIYVGTRNGTLSSLTIE